MDLYALNSNIAALGMKNNENLRSLTGLTGSLTTEKTDVEGNTFEAVFQSVLGNINTANGYLSDFENEQIKFMMGETENTHDLMISLNKASTALQYTVAVRDKLLEAYKELMQMQI